MKRVGTINRMKGEKKDDEVFDKRWVGRIGRVEGKSKDERR
jgi:hypothetical protein